MLTTYRRVLVVPGTLLFSLTGFVARLPISMVSLGIVLLISAERGSYALAGSVAAAYILANAALAVVHGRLADRLGQGRVLPVTQVLFGSFLVMMMWSVDAHWPNWLTHAFAAGAGASLPQIGSCIRARWSHVLDDPRQVQTAYALEAVVDEGVFIVGPILATVLATAVHPAAGLVVALVAGVGGTLFLSTQRGTEPPAHPRVSEDGVRAALPWRTVVPLVVLCFALGSVFGSAEVATVAFAEELGAKQYAGPLLALWALGSLVSGVGTGAISWRRSTEYRMRVSILALTLAMVPLTFIGSFPLMAVALLIGGLAISPTLISCLSITEQVVPRPRLTEGMAILHTGMAAGIAPGAAVAGYVIDHQGASWAYVVPVAAGVLGCVAALLTPTAAATVSP